MTATDTNMINSDVLCLACGYNLRGLKPDHLCPECATPAQFSLIPFRLRTNPQYFAALSSGLNLLRWSVAATLIGFACLAAYSVFGDASMTWWRPFEVCLRRLSVVCYLLQAWGAWRLTAANPSGRGASTHVGLRNLIRGGVIAGIISYVIWSGAVRYLPAEVRIFMHYFYVLLIGLEGAGEVAIIGYLVYLARDIPNRRLAAHAKWFMWCFGIVCVASSTMTTVFTFSIPLRHLHGLFLVLEDTGWATIAVYLWALVFLHLFLKAVRADKAVGGSAPLLATL